MHPVLFYIGKYPVHSYGVMLGLSCVLGAHLAVYLSGRSGIDRGKAWSFALAVILTGLIGGRIHDLLVTNKFTLEELFRLQHAGRTAYGAFLAATVGGVIAARVLRISFWRISDAVAPTMALGLGLTRIGCFLYGCDFGLRSEGWGVCFPRLSPAWTHHYEAGLIPFVAESSLPVLPVQLLASLAGLLIGGFTLWLWFRRPRRDGTILLTFFCSYGIVRALLELLRDDPGRGELLGLSTSTWIGLATAAVGALGLFLPPLARLRGESPPVLAVGEVAAGAVVDKSK